jgi:hypothetical protein
VKYGPKRPIRVRLRVQDGQVTGEVQDEGNPTLALRLGERVDPHAGGGLGLRVLDELATQWGVREGSTHVWFELAGRSPDPPGSAP